MFWFQPSPLFRRIEPSEIEVLRSRFSGTSEKDKKKEKKKSKKQTKETQKSVPKEVNNVSNESSIKSF